MAAYEGIKFDTKELAELGRVLKTVDRDAWKAANKELRGIVRPIANEVKNEALSIPVSTDGGGRASRLRQGIAKAVEIKSSTTSKNGAFVRIRVSGSKFVKASGITNPRLPRYMEGLSRRPWRHPVWPPKGADRGTWKGAWVEQDSHPFMLPTALKHKSQVRDKLAIAFEKEIANKLNRIH